MAAPAQTHGSADYSPSNLVLPAPRSRFLPSFSDFFLVTLVLWLFYSGLGWQGLVLDGDTGWHIRTGDYVLANRAVPKTDLFSFSKPNEPWFAWEWLSDVIYSLLHSSFGLAGVAVMSGIVICATATLVLRQMIRRGANGFIAVGLTFLTIGASSIHFHARPHLFTMLMLAVFVWVIDSDRERNTRWLWALVPLTALWTNLHGGFPVGIAYAGLLSVGLAAQLMLSGRDEWSQPLRYLTLSAGCALASLVNPYGVNLHLHVIEYLRAGFIRNMVQEFESPRFRSEEMLQFEVLLIAGVMVSGLLLLRKRIPEALWVLFFAHMSLGSVRHVPLFTVVAAPIIAAELTRVWTEWAERQPKKSTGAILHRLSLDFRAGFGKLSFWSPFAVAVILVLTPSSSFPTDFPKEHFPTRMVAEHTDRITKASRIFTTDQWGDYLIYKLYPKTRVFFDGRSDFYGEQHCKDFVAISGLNFRWRELIEKHRFDMVLMPVKSPLASALKISPEWKLIADDGAAVLFAKRPL